MIRNIAIIGLLLSVFGAYEAFKISYMHFNTVESCPTLSFLPACYVVLVSYSLMALAWLGSLAHRVMLLNNHKNKLFWIGFTPAFLLALIGVTGEIFGFVDCPETPSGLPKCFVSLGFVILIASGWIIMMKKKNIS